jgi:hypothetical protein
MQLKVMNEYEVDLFISYLVFNVFFLVLVYITLVLSFDRIYPHIIKGLQRLIYSFITYWKITMSV